MSLEGPFWSPQSQHGRWADFAAKTSAAGGRIPSRAGRKPGCVLEGSRCFRFPKMFTPAQYIQALNHDAFDVMLFGISSTKEGDLEEGCGTRRPKHSNARY